MMMNKINAITCIIVSLLITNSLGWTHIPWLLLQIPAAVIAVIWAWAIIIATIVVADDIKKKH